MPYAKYLPTEMGVTKTTWAWSQVTLIDPDIRYWTDGAVLLRRLDPLPPPGRPYKDPLDVTSYIGKFWNTNGTAIYPVLFTEREGHPIKDEETYKAGLVKFDNGVYIARHYYDYIKNKHRAANWYFNGDNMPLTAAVKHKPVALVMPYKM